MNIVHRLRGLRHVPFQISRIIRSVCLPRTDSPQNAQVPAVRPQSISRSCSRFALLSLTSSGLLIPKGFRCRSSQLDNAALNRHFPVYSHVLDMLISITTEHFLDCIIERAESFVSLVES